MDTVDRETRSRIMRAIKCRDTKPELTLRRALNGSLLRRRRDTLPGKPDALLPGVAVFVHGCFWHGCPRHYREPRSNVAFWRAKLAGNRRRDVKVRRRLNRMGWSVAVVWECGVRRDVDRLAERLLNRSYG